MNCRAEVCLRVHFAWNERNAGLPYPVIDTFADARASLRRPDWTGVILDIFMPGGTGVDLLEATRRHHRNCLDVLLARGDPRVG